MKIKNDLQEANTSWKFRIQCVPPSQLTKILKTELDYYYY